MARLKSSNPRPKTIQYPEVDPLVTRQLTGAAGAAGVGVPTGGLTDQVLGKTSGTSYATDWRNPYGKGVIVVPGVPSGGDDTAVLQAAIDAALEQRPAEVRTVTRTVERIAREDPTFAAARRPPELARLRVQQLRQVDEANGHRLPE